MDVVLIVGVSLAGIYVLYVGCDLMRSFWLKNKHKGESETIYDLMRYYWLKSKQKDETETPNILVAPGELHNLQDFTSASTVPYPAIVSNVNAATLQLYAPDGKGGFHPVYLAQLISVPAPLLIDGSGRPLSHEHPTHAFAPAPTVIDPVSDMGHHPKPSVYVTIT